ncbi:MAG: pilus assembly protein PilM [Vicinamibacterales bacterium]
MRLPSMLRTPPPSVAIEIASARVTAVAVSGRGAGVTLDAWAVEPLPEGAVVPSLTAPNVARPDEVIAAVRAAFERLRQRPARVAVAIPDAAAKVSLVRFKDVPARSADLEELVKFQIRKAAPFRVEDSQVSFAAGDRSAEGQEFVVVQARRDIVAEYEAVCQAAGAAAGVVDLTTFGLAQCALRTTAGLTGDWLLIHGAPDGATIAIYRGRHPVFFRRRGADGDGHLGDLVHQTAMYYQDRLGGQGFSRVLAGGAAPPALTGAAWSGIQARLGVRAELVALGGGAPVDAGLSEAIPPAFGLAASLWAEA